MTCHPDLQRLAREAIKLIDFSVICGHRGQADQDLAYENGTSREHWPHSRHNSMPSRAMDLCPVPLNWKDRASFEAVAVVIKATAVKLGIAIVWGGDFKHFPDLPHFELATAW